MFALIPPWAHHYDAFWQTLRKRNLWFIKLRYGAVFMLLMFLLSAEFLLGFDLSSEQEIAIVGITVSIFVYNLFIIILRKHVKLSPGSFNPIHISLIQVIADLTALLLLVHYTGGIESPLFMLYIFHMIIGSMILPEAIIFIIAALLIICHSGMVYAEYTGILQHYSIGGLLTDPVYLNSKFIAVYLTVFAFVMLMSVIIANTIAKQLYKMEQDLFETIDKLNAAEAEKQRYIMGVVHEIKSPITAVHSYLDVIIQKFLGPLNEKIEEKLIRAKTRSNEAIDLINNVLKISKIRLLDEVTKEDIDINTLICGLINKYKSEGSGKEIEFVLNDYRDTKKNLHADKLLIELAFSNLLGNAIKYSGENSIVEVTLNNKMGYTVIQICDNGIGIPPEDQSKLFNDFFRASNTKQRNIEGAGLGLSIVKQIIQRHGGSISVESPSILGTKAFPGTCFIIKIPE